MDQVKPKSNEIQKHLESLRANYRGFPVYNAAFPGYPRNFSRDSFISGILMNDRNLLNEQLIFSSNLQGQAIDSHTGEEPGKIHHEYPGVEMNGKNTLYNACDTTALYLIAMETYLSLTGDSAFVKKYKRNIQMAADYIERHLRDGLFWESPAFSDSDDFALKITYWKDSQLPAKKEKPSYPIVYTLAHFQNARAMRSAGLLLEKNRYIFLEEKMVEAGFEKLWDKDQFIVAIDGDGKINGLSSDNLHVLAYLDHKKKALRKLVSSIEQTTKPLETVCGYRCTSVDLLGDMKDQYHGATSVWVFEQAAIHAGGKKFGSKLIQENAEKIRKYLDTNPEILHVDESNKITKLGCDPQLWSLAAKHYFDNNEVLSVL